MKKKPVVFIVDDHPSLRDAMAKMLKTVGLRCKTYGSAEAFLAAYRPTGPGCLVLDVRMPGLSGLELQQRLRAAPIAPPIIFVTAHADVRMAVDAMEAGAFGFMEKPFRMQELCDKVQNALAWDEKQWACRSRRQMSDRKLALLTPSERKVLELIVAGNTNKVIAQQLEISVRTVEVHRAKMQKKLGMKSRADLTRLMRGEADE